LPGGSRKGAIVNLKERYYFKLKLTADCCAAGFIQKRHRGTAFPPKSQLDELDEAL